ncbi:MAG: DUF5777 family beta-barrel protein [Chitinivibrionales bacterium]|nr:DUF5777 family beta-barrel protein [Chitinivibrionales bacterium]
MKRCGVLLWCILSISLSYSYDENNMPDLTVPTQLGAKSLEASIEHRFIREPGAKFPDNFVYFANVKLGLRYVVLPKLEVGTSYQTYKREFNFNTAYSLFFPQAFLRTQALVQFFGARQNPLDANDLKMDYNFMYQVNFQSEPIVGRFLPAVDIAYDGLAKRAGIGTGLDIVLVNDHLDLLGEYYPVIGKRDTVPGGGTVVNYIQAAIKATVGGHQFMFTVGNFYDIGMRRLMAGAQAPINNIYYGFNIFRLFTF